MVNNNKVLKTMSRLKRIGEAIRKEILGPVPRTKKFSGQTYYLFVLADHKGEALREAARLRKNGYKARVHYAADWTAIYSYPKTPNWYSGMYLKKRNRR